MTAISSHYEGPVIAQVLIGVDFSRYLSVAVVDEEGLPVQTANCHLKRSLLSEKYLIFGTAKPDDELIKTPFPTDFGANINS